MFQQPIVIHLKQYHLMGTANLLEALRVLNYNCTAVIITSDKVYNNIEKILDIKRMMKLVAKIFIVAPKVQQNL